MSEPPSASHEPDDAPVTMTAGMTVRLVLNPTSAESVATVLMH